MLIETARSRTTRIIEESMLLDTVDAFEDATVDELDDEVLSSAGGPYHWVPDEE